MKIIHVAGWSGSGKTTFILDLVAALSKIGLVGTIKHIGEHICDLPEGKDTTRHYDAGAFITAGIDLEKTMISRRSISFPAALDMLSDAGVTHAVVEGFKEVPFRKVVIGDLDVTALVRDPSVSDVIRLLPEFDDYYTLAGLLHDVEAELGGGVIYTLTGHTCTALPPADCTSLEEEISRFDGITVVRVRFNRPVFEESTRFFVVIRAETQVSGTLALARCGQVIQVDNVSKMRDREGDTRR